LSTLARKAHQDGDIEWIHRVQRGLLANEPGLGKSRSAIDATSSASRVLVVAPSLVLSSGTWEDEINRWGADSDCAYTLAPYSMLNQRKKGPRGGSVPIRALREEYQGAWDAIIIDEAHYVKGRKTSWTWAVQQIAGRSEIVLPMTGTPIPNWAHEVFTLLQIIYPHESKPGGKYGSFWRWAGEWFDTTPTRFSNGNPVVGELLGCSGSCFSREPSDPCEHYRRFSHDNFGAHWRRCLRKDCLDLPPFTEQTIKVPMTTAQRRIYKELKKDFMATVSGEEVLAWTQGAKNVMLDKVTISPWLLNPEGEPHGGKFERLRFDLESRSRPTVVFAHYRSVVEACARVASSTGARAGYVHGGNKAAAGQIVRDFKDGKLDVLVGSLELLAEGITLTNSDMAIMFEKSYKPYRNEQALFRVHRMGQVNPVTILDYVTPDSVDVNKRRTLATKTDRQMRMMTAAEFTALL
jgi:superfamily II DNA or RNA helicase